jgi:hypothetical protein
VWTDWRFGQVRDWQHRQPGAVQAALVIGFLVVAAVIVWWVI